MLFDEYHSEAWSIAPEVARRMQPEAPFNSFYAQSAQALAQRGFAVAFNANSLLTAELLRSAPGVEAQLIGERRCRPARCDLLSRRDTAHLLTPPPRAAHRLR